MMPHGGRDGRSVSWDAVNRSHLASHQEASARWLGWLNRCWLGVGKDSRFEGSSTTSVSNSLSIAPLINGSCGSFSIGSYQGRRSVALASTARAMSCPTSSPSNGTSLPELWRKSWGQK